MIKRKRSHEDEDHRLPPIPISSPYNPSNSSQAYKPSKLARPARESDISAGIPILNIDPVTMLSSNQQGQPAPGSSQASPSTMEETRNKYIQIQQGLKNEIQQFGQNHPRGIAALKKLEQFNQHMTNLRNQQASQRQAQAAANAAANSHAQTQAQSSTNMPLPPQVVQARPVQPASQQAMSNRPSTSMGTAGGQMGNASSAGNNGVSQPMKLLVPGHIDPENADNWRREAEARLRTAYASMVSFRTSLQALQAALNNPEKPLSDTEMVDKKAQLEQIQKQNKKCEDFINAFRMQQSTLVRNAAATGTSSTELAPSTNLPQEPAPTTTDSPANMSTLPNTSSAAPSLAKLPATAPPKAPAIQRTPPNIGSVGNALAAASAQNTASSTQTGSQKSPTSANPLRAPGTQATFTPASALPQVSPQAPHGNPRSSSMSGSTPSHPHALQQAISQQGLLDSAAKPVALGGASTPVGQRDGASAHRLPIPKTLSMPAPTAVVVAPARPTLPGGTHAPSGSQVVGAPAIAKAPQFELDEASGGLLSKRKLQELVRQINPDESLDPEAEESILELTDDFVDTLLTYACRMAKHRGSDTLEIRDVQMILERNWNIRIPGYSMDDIRTVRKFNPTASYQQKLQALQAGKALNQSELSKDA